MAARPTNTLCRWAVLLGLIGALTSVVGCVPDLQPPAHGGYYVQTRCDLLRCQPQSTPPKFDILVPPTFPSVATYQKLENVWKDKSKTYPLYVYPGNVRIIDVGTNEIPGCTLVQTNQGDWSLQGTSFLRLSLNEAVDAAYLAYDARVKGLPLWLREPDYSLLITQDGRAPLQITTSLVDQTQNPPDYVKLNLYRINKAGPPGIIEIPANDEGAPDWSPITKGSPAMYVVFVRPKPLKDCTNGTKQNAYVYTDCCNLPISPENDQKALELVGAAALAKCAVDHPLCLCTNAGSTSHYMKNCSTDTTITGEYPLTVTPSSFEQSSEVAFRPSAAIASGIVHGQPFTTEASGYLDFTYEVDQTGTIPSLQILSLSLDLAPFQSEVGLVDDISLVLLQSTAAQCTDNPAPVATPCSRYVIAPGVFAGNASCRVAGTLVVAATTNTAEIGVLMSPNEHTFSVQVAGTLSTTIHTSTDDIPVEITIALAGEVLNYAPHPVASFEGNSFAECQDGTNETPIHMYASDSFDIDEGIPPSANFDWYEDYGLVTEKAWGHGLSATIGPHQLGFGAHTITLVVRDSYGVTAQDTFTVVVQDTIPPTWNTIPGDLAYFPSSREPYQITAAELGTAGGHDDCSAQVVVSNDAPADLRFSPGETIVNWTADDGGGQIATFEQRVTIIPLDDPPQLVETVIAGSTALSAGVSRCRDTLDTWSYCGLDLEPLISSVGRLFDLLNNTPASSDQELWVTAATGLVQQASAALQSADSLLKAEASTTEEITQNRASARDNLTTAYDALQAIAQSSGPTNPPVPPPTPPPRCAIATAARGTALEKDLALLRQFRDERLLTNRPGRCLVAAYYRISPPVADFIAPRASLRFLVRIALVPVIAGVKHPLAFLAVLLTAGIGLTWTRRRVKGRPGARGTVAACAA